MNGLIIDDMWRQDNQGVNAAFSYKCTICRHKMEGKSGEIVTRVIASDGSPHPIIHGQSEAAVCAKCMNKTFEIDVEQLLEEEEIQARWTW